MKRPDHLFHRQCVITTTDPSGDIDDYGNEIPDEVETETVCEVQQRRRTEEEDQGEVSESDWLGIFPPGTDLDTGASVWVENLGVFELVGAPWPVDDIFFGGAPHHIEATLRRTAGAEDAVEAS